MKTNKILITKILFILTGAWIGYSLLIFKANPYPNNDDILLYYPSIFISLPLSYVPLMLVEALGHYGFKVSMISGYHFRLHFFILSFFLGYFQIFYLFPKVWIWISRKGK